MAAGIVFLVGGHFTFTGNHASILLEVLPPIVHIRKESDKESLRWSLERMMQELSEQQPGGFLVAQHLAYMMLVQALRLHLAEGLKGGVGWLFALADKQMSVAINSMHNDPAQWLDHTEAGGACRHVAIDLCPEIQRDGWDVTHGIPDALANAAGRG
jgi:Cupin